MKDWRGAKRTMADPAKFTAARDFHFGGETIPKGSAVKQFETRNFGFTCWVTPEGVNRIARE